MTKPHSHDRDYTAICVAKVKAAMKDKAKVSRETPAQIFASAVANTFDDVRAEIGKKESLKRNIRNSQHGVLPKDISTLHDLEIDGEWAQTTGDQQFLVHDSARDHHNRVIVFVSDEGLRYLATQHTWFMDGTLKIAPMLFDQLYIIRAKVGESAVTCAYSLMTGKSQALYEEMLQAISSRSEQLGFSPDPVNIHMDFEQSVIQAVKSTFGDHVNVRGCFYHLTQSTWRKVQQLGLADQYHRWWVQIILWRVAWASVLAFDRFHRGDDFFKRLHTRRRRLPCGLLR